MALMKEVLDQAAVESFKVEAKKLIAYDLEELYKSKRNWPDAVPVWSLVSRLAPIVNVLLAIDAEDETLPRLPSIVLRELGQHCKDIATNLEQIRNADLTGSENDRSTYSRLSSAVDAAERNWFERSVIPLLYLREQTGHRESLRGDLAKARTELIEAKDEYARLVSDVRAQGEATAAALRQATDAAAQQWVTNEGAAFSSAQEGHAREAMKWAWASGVLAASLLGCVLVVVSCGSGPPLPHDPWSAGANLSHFSARLLGVTVLSFLMVTCVRTYRAARHNEIMNAHRWRALATLSQFREQSNGIVAEAIVLQAASAVFSVQDSGFVSGPVASNHVADLIAMTGARGKDEK